MIRTESVTVRPFFAIGNGVAEAFSETAIRFGAHESFQTEETVKTGLLPHEAALELRFSDSFGEAASQLAEMADWCLAVVLADETKRRSRLLRSLPLCDVPFGEQLSIGTSNLPLSWSGRRGGTISLYLSLAKDRPPNVGMPHRFAQTVAMKHFNVNKAGPGVEFPIDFKSPQELEGAGYPGDAAVVVLGLAEELTEQKAEEMNLSIAINERLRPAFAHARRSTRANVLQDTVKSQAIAQLILMAKELEDLDEESIGYRFVKDVLASWEKTPDALKTLSDSQLFAVAQVFSGLTESSSKVF